MKFLKYLLPCFLLLATAAPAKAYDGLGGLGLAYLFGYGSGGCGGYAVGAYNHSVPYFSLHPPVYYGQRYARPYGASPYAAWPQLQSNAGYAPAPQAAHSMVAPVVIHNQYLPANSHVSSTSNDLVEAKRAEPLKIENPYYRGDVQFTSQLR